MIVNMKFSPYQAFMWLLMVALAGLLALHDTNNNNTSSCVKKERNIKSGQAQQLPENLYPHLVENRYKQNRKWNPFLLQELPRSQKLIYKYAFGETTAETLISGLPPFTAHFVWCKPGIFEFKHYLSVLSVAKNMKVDKIVFHYVELPYHDMSEYNDWFERLFKELPHLVIKKLSDSDVKRCYQANTKTQFLASSVPSTGGIVVGLNTLVTSFSHKFRSGKTDSDLLSTSIASREDAFMIFSRKVDKKVMPTSIINCNSLFSSDGLQCLPLPEYLFPKDIMTDSSELAKWARWLLYGFKEPVSVTPSNKKNVPLRAHYLYIDHKELSFINFLSILSTLTVDSIENVYVHGKEPKGKYWEILKKQPKLTFLPEEYGKQIFEIKPKNIHSSKIFTASLILQIYGGIFVDDDVIWTNPDPSSWMHYPFTVGGLPSFTEEWPDIMNSGLMISKPGSRFLKNFIPTVRNYDAQVREDALSLDKILYRTYEDFPDYVYYKKDLIDIITAFNQFNCTSQFLASHPPQSALNGLIKGHFSDVDAVQVKFSEKMKEPHNSNEMPCEELSVLAKKVIEKSGVKY